MCVHVYVCVCVHVYVSTCVRILCLLIVSVFVCGRACVLISNGGWKHTPAS